MTQDLLNLCRDLFAQVPGLLGVVVQWIDIPVHQGEERVGFYRLTVLWDFDCDFPVAKAKPTQKMYAAFAQGRQLDWEAEGWPAEEAVNAILAEFAPFVRGLTYLKPVLAAEFEWQNHPRARNHYWEIKHVANANRGSLQTVGSAAGVRFIAVFQGPQLAPPEPALATAGQRDYGQNWGE